MAIDYGLVGPNLRGSGVDWDLRRDLPYGAYPDFEFEVPVGKRLASARSATPTTATTCACLEMLRVVADRPPGAGEASPRASSWPRSRAASSRRRARPSRASSRARGEMAYYVVSDGTEKAYRVRARTGSFTAMGIIEEISPGLMIADLVALIASLDVVAPEIDR